MLHWAFTVNHRLWSCKPTIQPTISSLGADLGYFKKGFQLVLCKDYKDLIAKNKVIPHTNETR